MMAKPMKRRDVEKALHRNGCVEAGSGRGSHAKWNCPCGSHTAPLPRHTTISPGVVADLIKKFPCLPKGWLQ